MSLARSTHGRVGVRTTGRDSSSTNPSGRVSCRGGVVRVFSLVKRRMSPIGVGRTPRLPGRTGPGREVGAGVFFQGSPRVQEDVPRGGTCTRHTGGRPAVEGRLPLAEDVSSVTPGVSNPPATGTSPVWSLSRGPSGSETTPVVPTFHSTAGGAEPRGRR